MSLFIPILDTNTTMSPSQSNTQSPAGPVLTQTITVVSVPLSEPVNNNTFTVPQDIQVTGLGGFQGTNSNSYNLTHYDAIDNLRKTADANALSQDLPTRRGSLFAELLKIADKPEAQRTDSEKSALEWLATKVQANRIEEKQNALDKYNEWLNDPWGYKTPGGFGFTAYKPNLPKGNIDITILVSPNIPPPDVRLHGTAIAHQEMITAAGSTAFGTTTKALARSQQNVADYQTLINEGTQSGLTTSEIGAITVGGVAVLGTAATAIGSATLTGASLGKLGAAIFPFSLAAKTIKSAVAFTPVLTTAAATTGGGQQHLDLSSAVLLEERLSY